MSKMLICLVAGGLLALGACSADGDGAQFVTTGGSGGGPTGGSGGTGPDGGDLQGGSGGTDIIPPVADELLITVEQGTTARGFPFSRAGATFSSVGNREVPHLRYVENCSIADSRDFQGYAAQTPTAGTITISVTRTQGEKELQDIVMEPLLVPGRLRAPELYAYETPPLEAPRWAPLDRLIITAQGAEIVSFQEALVFPERVEVRSAVPRAIPTRLPTVRRDQDLQVEWEPVDQQVGITITQYRQDALDTPAYRVRCSFLGHLGFGRISPVVLADLDDDDMLSKEVSRTEVFVSGQRVTQATKGMHHTWITLNNGRILMVNVE
jgi:hypothetical protein